MTAAKAISKIEAKWKALIWAKIVCSWALILFLGYVSFWDNLPIEWQILLTVTSFAISYLFFRNQFPNKSQVHQLVNAQIPNLEYSVSLIEKQPETTLARLQQQKVKENLLSKSRSIRFPLKLRQLLWILVFGGVLVACIRIIQPTDNSPIKEETSQNSQQNIAKADTVESLKYSVKITIRPPAYTGLKTRQQTQPGLDNVLSESMITWQLSFNRNPKSAWIRFSNGDSVSCISAKGKLRASSKVETKGFYTINFLDDEGETHLSDYYKLNVILDNPPEVKIHGIPQYQSISPGEADGTQFVASAADEFGLSKAYMVATITKGSGESVKFREEKIPFRKHVSGKTFRETVRFSIDQFGMEPGNELYFYVEAWDNHIPAQASRTETFFFVLEDTAEYAFSLEGNLGVDLMPEYFRSQRQIIIDSEKLLAEKSSISKQEFNQRSNELGFDQKTLRLKYGQFMGEEADSGLDIENEVEPDAEHENKEPGQVDVLSEFGHDHDHENEEGQLMDKGTEKFEDPVKELSHSHDDTDQATFFGETMKDKLRAALNEMWDAELYLRLFKPEESLPYQYKALKLIKEIKNHARIYVHRMGFDAPPIKEAESRLSGDLDHVHGEQFETTTSYQESFSQTKLLIQAIAEKEKAPFPQKNSLKVQLQASGNELAGKAIEEPGKYLSLLSLIREVSDQEELDQKSLVSLKLKLLKVINAPDQKPTLKSYPTHELIDQFILELNKSNP
ncbi:MAG: hypothetical protein RIC35_05665 [Marinoscillum sp.]